MDEVKWIVGIVTVLAVLWLLSGGADLAIEPRGGDANGSEPVSYLPRSAARSPTRSTASVGPSKPRTPEEERRAVARELALVERELKEVQEAVEELEEKARSSVYREKLTLSATRARSKTPADEYVIITAPRGNTESVPVTGLRIESAMTGRSISIPEGTMLPVSGQSTVNQPVVLGPGEHIIVTTGRSPIGASFRLNLCTGYFEQFQNFSPALPRECPLPRDEPEIYVGELGTGVTDQCEDFVNRLSRCTVYTKKYPTGFDHHCQEWINRNVNYNACVDRHRADENFYKTEWRVYIGSEEELWKEKREVLKLVDKSGLLIDSVTY